MTQEELADKLGVRQSYISAWERDVKRPSYELLARLNDALAAFTYDEYLQAVSRTVERAAAAS